uniref:Uncharacterized protein n=1 Tax=Oryza brachyantha TaxID=4533 RepID=J3MU45_ORYBR
MRFCSFTCRMQLYQFLELIWRIWKGIAICKCLSLHACIGQTDHCLCSNAYDRTNNVFSLPFRCSKGVFFVLI